LDFRIPQTLQKCPGSFFFAILITSAAVTITWIGCVVESQAFVDTLTDISGQFHLRPAELPSRFDVPCPLLGSQLRLQNDYVLCPADGHGLSQHLWCALIGAVELPHPAQVPGGAGGIRVRSTQILGCGDSGALLWLASDQPANLTVQFHLRQVRHHQGVQHREHGAVVNGFSDVHSGFSFPARVRLFYSLGFEIANEQALGRIRGLAP
jgi:hypothetical protein